MMNRIYSKKKTLYSPGSSHIRLVNTYLENSVEHANPSELSIALQRAALINDLSAIGALLDRGADINSTDDIGRTPLMEAVFSGHQSAVALLIIRGADINAMDQDGWTALMEATSKGRFEIASMLLASGADVKVRNRNGTTASEVVAKKHLKLLKLLTDAIEKNLEC